MKLISKISDWIGQVFFALAMLGGLLMMLHVTADVVARTVFNIPLPGTGELSAGYYMIAIAFLPLAYVTKHDMHISADLFTAVLPHRYKIFLMLLIDILSIWYVYLITIHTYTSAMRRTRSGEVWEIWGGYLPIWPARWIIPIAAASMLLVLFTKVVERSIDFVNNKGES